MPRRLLSLLKKWKHFKVFGLPDKTFDALLKLFDSYTEISEVVIYGSRAKGNFRPGSDIDLTLKGTGLTNEDLNRLLVDLDNLNTPYLFDVSIFKDLNTAELIEHVERVGKVFYRR